MRRKLMATALLGEVLLLIGFFTQLMVLNQRVYAIHTHSDSRILPPMSESLTTLNVSKVRSILQVLVSANSTLMIDVLHAGNVEWKWEDTEFKRSVLLLNAGTWIVRIRNNSTTSCCDYTSTIRLKELHLEPRKPYVWLRLPLLISGGLSISLVVPIYFSNKFKNRLNKKAIEIIIAVIIVLALVFSYQLAGLILHTSTPWVVSEGVSMMPAINFGDLVIIMGTETQNLLPDDIILFQKISLDMGGEDFSTMSVPVLHRIVYITKTGNHRYFKTKGDISEKPDEWFVPDEGVLGKAALVVPKLGFVLLMLERIEVKLFIIAIIFFISFIWPSIKPKIREKVFPLWERMKFKHHTQNLMTRFCLG